MRNSAMKLGAVLLAAGEGSRMGGVPKCLLTLDGATLISRHLSAMRETGIDRVVVVTGYYHEQIEPVIAAVISDARVAIARNPEPEAGQQSSVRIGIEALGPTFDLVIVALADQPLVGSEDLTELIAAFKNRPPGTQIVYPQVSEQRGNPVLFAGELIADMLSSGTQVAGRKFIDEHPQLVHVHQTRNDRFIVDVDTRDDIATFEQRTGLTLAMPVN
jgi:molybdenum cofactor cytidylyltransferase/nicotine blue oxidoreductase